MKRTAEMFPAVPRLPSERERSPEAGDCSKARKDQTEAGTGMPQTQIAQRHLTYRDQAQAAARVAANTLRTLGDELGPENPWSAGFLELARQMEECGDPQGSPARSSGERTLRLVRSR